LAKRIGIVEAGRAAQERGIEAVRRGHILIVDDYPINRRLTQVLLEKHGFKVRLAGNAAACLAELERQLPNMVLMDIGLPDMSGLALTQIIRNDPHTARLTIVAYTGHTMVGDRERILASGCDGYIPKPIDPQRLLTEVQRYLRVAHSESA
jgi:two-component system, cell cycle response regulator DivK